MHQEELTPISYFGQLKLIHFALIMGQVIFALVVLFLNVQEGGKARLELDLIVQIAIVLFILIGILMSNLIVSNRLKLIQAQDTLRKKLEQYKTIQIMRYGLLEAPSLLALLAYFLSADVSYLGLSVLALIFFVIYQPDRKRLIKDLKLNPDEIVILENPKSIIV